MNNLVVIVNFIYFITQRTQEDDGKLIKRLGQEDNLAVMSNEMCFLLISARSEAFEGFGVEK